LLYNQKLTAIAAFKRQPPLTTTTIYNEVRRVSHGSSLPTPTTLLSAHVAASYGRKKTRFLQNSKMGQIYVCYLQTFKLTFHIKNLMKHYHKYIFAVVIPVSHQAIISFAKLKRVTTVFVIPACQHAATRLDGFS
jgi:hypothetical protein